LYLQPGESAGCVGCHEPRHLAPERPVMPPGMAIHTLRPAGRAALRRGLELLSHGQPVLDHYCVGCHGLDTGQDEINLLGTLQPVTFPRNQWPGPNKMLVSRAYQALVTRDGLVKVALADMETDYSTRWTTLPMRAGWRRCSSPDIRTSAARRV